FFVRQKTEEEIHRRLTIFSLKSTSTAVHDADVEVRLVRHLTKKTGFGDYTRQLCSVIFNISCLVLERILEVLFIEGKHVILGTVTPYTFT
ncbi:unnamed protein product, partial [Tenebrio molitor]